MFHTQQWSSMQVAGAYIDLTHNCTQMPQADKVVCYLLAAMWMARSFNSNSKYPTDVLYGYKSILMNILLLCCETAMYYCCNSGFESYVIWSIGIIKKIAQIPHVFTEEDAFFLQKLLQRFSTVKNMNIPLFHMLPFSLSETIASYNIIRKVHSAFIFDLESKAQGTRRC